MLILFAWYNRTFEPSFFIQVDQLQRYSDIFGYKDGVVESEVKPYLDEFSGTARQEQLMVGKMTLEQVEVSWEPLYSFIERSCLLWLSTASWFDLVSVDQAEEQRLQTEYLAFQEQEAKKQRERQTQIATSQEQAKREVQKTLRKRRKALLKKEVQFHSSWLIFLEDFMRPN